MPSVWTNATGTHHIQPSTLTPRRTNSKKLAINRKFRTKQPLKLIQNVGRGQLVRLMLMIDENGSSMPTIAACHLWGIPALSTILAAAKAAITRKIQIKRSAHTCYFSFAEHFIRLQ
jgi:hypothetical protein